MIVMMEGTSKYDIVLQDCQDVEARQRHLASRPGVCLVVTWVFSHIPSPLSRGFRGEFFGSAENELLKTITLQCHVLIAIADVAAWL